MGVLIHVKVVVNMWVHPCVVGIVVVWDLFMDVQGGRLIGCLRCCMHIMISSSCMPRHLDCLSMQSVKATVGLLLVSGQSRCSSLGISKNGRWPLGNLSLLRNSAETVIPLI